MSLKSDHIIRYGDSNSWRSLKLLAQWVGLRALMDISARAGRSARMGVQVCTHGWVILRAWMCSSIHMDV